MANLPTFSNEYPIYQPVKVEPDRSGAIEAEGLRQALGGVTQTFRKVGQIKSNTNLLANINNIQNLHSQTELELLKNPQNSLDILKHYNNTTTDLIANADLLDKDRSKLKTINQGLTNRLALQSFK